MDSTSDRLRRESFPRPPHGRRMVWAGKRRPAVEGAPLALPGVVTEDLPDGWTLVSWLDKDGWYSPDAVYEVKSLRAVSDAEFDDLVRAVRDSPDWRGIVHNTDIDPEPSPYVVGASVMWIGPVLGDNGWNPRIDAWRLAVFGDASGPPARGHRGRIVEVSQSGAFRVRWIDKDGEFEGRVFIDPGAVAVVGIASGG
ncbi:hypothetical protein ABTZ46_13970 [Nocardioides sp. NPDC126508]